MRTLSLTNSDKRVLVTDMDYYRVSKHKWYLLTTEDGNEYARCASSHKIGLLHRFILKPDRRDMIDHIDGNGLNNCRSNLRISNNQLNQANSRKLKPGKSKYKGVSSKRHRWRAYICPDRKFISLGEYDTEEQAAAAYNEAALKQWGEHACLNKLG